MTSYLIIESKPGLTTSVEEGYIESMNKIDEFDVTTQVLALIMYGDVSPRTFDALMTRFESVDRILKADESSLGAISGMTATAAKKIAKCAESLPLAKEHLISLGNREIDVSTRFDKDFPSLLFELNDPPPLLYVRGKLPSVDKKTVALVGTSQANNEGIEMTSRLARTFAENDVQVVSTLVGGIGDAAHLGCKSADGSSFAVLEAGFDSLIDSESMPVAIDLARSGGVICEHQPDHELKPDAYRESNRIVVGLSQAVVVTEFYKDSTRTLDLLRFCDQIGKLTFVMIDPEYGAFTDEKSLETAIECGAVALKGYDKVDDIIRSLV